MAGDFVEGQSMAYLLRLAGHQVLVMGSMNYIEREMEGLQPDIALVAANDERLEIHDYTGRLMRVLGYPPLVLPTHWDGYGYAPLREQAQAAVHQFADEVRAASPQNQGDYSEVFRANHGSVIRARWRDAALRNHLFAVNWQPSPDCTWITGNPDVLGLGKSCR